MTERSTTGLLSDPELPAESRANQVLLFGELLADCFPDAERIGGAPFNVARHLRAFGVNPLLVSRIGKDELGRRLQACLAQWRMDPAGIQTDDAHPSGQVRVHVSGSGHRFEILPDQAYDHIEAEAARRVAAQSAPALLYFGTLIQRQEPSRLALQALLQACGAPCFLDLNLRPPWYERGIVEASLLAADVLKLNLEELAIVAALLDLPQAPPERLASELMGRYSIGRVLVTAGAEGAWLRDQEGRITRVQALGGEPAQGVGGLKPALHPPMPFAISSEGGEGQAAAAFPASDSVGAGDAFSAVFIVGLLRHWPTSLALQRADAFARAICGIRGAVPLDDAFYGPFLAAWGIGPGDSRW